MSRSNHIHAAFYDFNGLSNFSDTFNDEDDAFTDLTIGAGTYLFTTLPIWTMMT